ncbi:MAG: mechanosensitive ion channel [Magnetococcus sp. YQC-5]
MTAYTQVWKNDTISPEVTATIIGLLNQELTAIPGEVVDESVDGRRRTVLKNRVDMLRQLGEVEGRRRELTQIRPEKGRAEADLDGKIREWEKKPAAPVPVNPNQEAFKILGEKRAERLQSVKALQETRDNRRQLMQRIPEMIQAAKTTQTAAEEEIRKLPLMDGKGDAAKKSLAVLQRDNLELSVRLSQDQVALWNAELAFEKEHGVRQDKELELAQRIFEWEESQFKQYQEALNQQLTQALEVKVDALAKKEKAAEKAATPQEKVLAQWEILVAQTQKNIADWQQLRTEVATAITGQETRIKEESTEMGNLSALVKRMGSQGMAAELLKSTFRLMGQRRLELEQVIPATMRKRLSVAQSRRLEIETRLGSLRDQWRAELLAVHVEGETEKQRQLTKEKATRFFDAYRQGLLDEKRVLFEINVDERRLELLTMERANVLDGLERFVLSKVFWIQDAEPITWHLLSGMLDEIAGADRENSLLRWMERLLSAESLSRVVEAVNRPMVLFYGLLLSLALLMGIPLSRHWMRSVKGWQMQPYGTRSFFFWLLPMMVAVAEAAWWSIYFLIAALVLDAAGLPEGIGTVLARILTLLALFFFLWRLSRRLFEEGGIATRQFQMPIDLAAILMKAMRVMLLAYPSLLMPWIIFRGTPFDFHVLPRLGYTAYECCAGAVLYYLIRDSSPLVRHSFGGGETREGQPQVKKSLLAEQWGLIRGVIVLGILAIVGLDVMGYRFGAATITRNGLLSLLTLFIVLGLYRLSLAVAVRLSRDRRWMISVAPGEEEAEHQRQSALSMRKFLRIIFIVIGGLMLASYWGVNKQTLDALNEYTLMTTTMADGSVDSISVADLLRFVVILVISSWLVRHLPGLFELLIFSRMRMDQGARYAILTMTRYGVVLIGMPMALSALHVDLGKIAWLAAAISVGIGFGLQEIVANFVSGIILLLERPVRVGDRISVGTVMGEVRRINIRATRVVNLDLQEILIPNRDLITREVINWTLSSRAVRLIVSIGVAYGSDIEQVRGLLLGVARDESMVLRDPVPRALFMNHGPSALEFQLRVYHLDPDLRSTLMDRLNTAINRVFRAHGIEIPFPQQELHIRSESRGSLNEVDEVVFQPSKEAPSPPERVAMMSMIKP